MGAPRSGRGSGERRRSPLAERRLVRGRFTIGCHWRGGARLAGPNTHRRTTTTRNRSSTSPGRLHQPAHSSARSERPSPPPAPTPDEDHRRYQDHHPPQEQPDHLGRGHGGALDHGPPREDGPPSRVGQCWTELIATTYLRSRRVTPDCRTWHDAGLILLGADTDCDVFVTHSACRGAWRLVFNPQQALDWLPAGLVWSVGSRLAWPRPA